MNKHSPTPWSFVTSGEDEIIVDADGAHVHTDTAYYPSGIGTDDAKFIVECVNKVSEMRAALQPFAAMADKFDETSPDAKDDVPLTVNRGEIIVIGHMRAARRALTGK